MPTTVRNTDILFNDGTTQGSASNYIQRVYTSPATWTKPAGLQAVKITVVGGGGGGGGVSTVPGVSTGPRTGGRGGSARDSSLFNILSAPAIPGPVTVTIGAGGAGGSSSGTPGTSGGTSSYGAFLSATGGGGGVGVTTPSTVGANGTVGGLTTGPAVGVVQYNTTTLGEVGITGRDPATINAIGLGAGGGGGLANSDNRPGVAGGNGAPGIVIVEEFY